MKPTVMPAARGNAPQVALITGASSGLGKALAEEVAGRGRMNALILTARRSERLELLASELRQIQPGLQTDFVVADLADPRGCETVARFALTRHGGVDVLINNAGLGLPTLFSECHTDRLAEQIAVNFRAPLLLTRLLLPSLIERKGIVINIGSAITSVANSALGAYGATKAGLAYWNDALRRELRSCGVRICLVEPGPFATEFMTAVRDRSAEGQPLHPVHEMPRDWMSAEVRDVARRTIDLLDRPRRRISVPRRLVWPLRLMGALFQLIPALGDQVVTRGFGVERNASHSSSPAHDGLLPAAAGDAEAPPLVGESPT
jgi:short-subunit dehydrogenase